MERHPLPKLIWADFPGGAVVKNSPASGGDARDEDLILGLERSPGEGNGNTLEYTCLENPIYRGACQVTAHGVLTVPKVLRHFNINSKV